MSLKFGFTPLLHPPFYKLEGLHLAVCRVFSSSPGQICVSLAQQTFQEPRLSCAQMVLFIYWSQQKPNWVLLCPYFTEFLFCFLQQ